MTLVYESQQRTKYPIFQNNEEHQTAKLCVLKNVAIIKMNSYINNYLSKIENWIKTKKTKKMKWLELEVNAIIRGTDWCRITNKGLGFLLCSCLPSVAKHNKSKYTDGKVSVILYDTLPNKDLTTACPFLFEMTQGGLNEASTIARMRFVQNYSLQTSLPLSLTFSLWTWSCNINLVMLIDIRPSNVPIWASTSNLPCSCLSATFRLSLHYFLPSPGNPDHKSLFSVLSSLECSSLNSFKSFW